jgi:hypothetical protein
VLQLGDSGLQLGDTLVGGGQLVAETVFGPARRARDSGRPSCHQGGVAVTGGSGFSFGPSHSGLGGRHPPG